MTEKELIKQLNTLKSVKPDQNWKKQEKSRFLALITENSVDLWQNEVIQVFKWDWLFQPVPRMAMASLVILLVAGSLSFSFLISGSNFFGESSIVVSQYKHKEMKVVNEETNKEIGKSDKISPLFVPVDSYTSIGNEADLLLAFKMNLMEKINRIWVLALESGNEEAFAIAREAEKFFGEGDYDAALRAIIVAEGMLNE